MDKTKGIFDLVSRDSCYFLSRPRRFGKSLLVSTLKEIFQGNRELFKGLYIYDKIKWEKHPVIHLDFSVLDHNEPVILQKAIVEVLEKEARKDGFILESELPGGKFKELLEKLSIHGKVVILIDEYDKPIIDHINNLEKAQANREILRNFYAVLKGADAYLRFVFLTGVSRFSKVSVFSGLNNIIDITLHEEYATLLGINQEELEVYFKEYMVELAGRRKIEEGKLPEIIKHWYNGYSWDGVNRLYNPTSLLNLFFDKRFSNYWFATGTPTFLIELMKKRKTDIAEVENRIVSSSVLDSYDIENLELYSLLFQTGYLTIAEVIETGQIEQYRLKYPNFEVKESFLNYLLASYTDYDTATIQPLYMQLMQHLTDRNIPAFQALLVNLFSRIPYNLHIREERYYHSLCYMILALMGAEINLEVLSDKGRMDGVLELDRAIYVIEFKLGTAAEALEQIKSRRYWEPYTHKGKELFLLGIGGFKEQQNEVVVEEVQGGNDLPGLPAQ